VNEDCKKIICPKNVKKIPTDSPYRALQTPFTSCIPKVSPFGRNWEKYDRKTFFGFKCERRLRENRLS
jgi:hypothetical protein